MTDLLTVAAMVLVAAVVATVAGLIGYGRGIATGLRDAARSARYSADLRRRDTPRAAAILDDFADRQERRADSFRRADR